ncbi:hypothetical protein PINS_up019751 [Pythium insidiosum]|nr:hypothetical protein PINS_up019751 [Pythium insidiosum]
MRSAASKAPKRRRLSSGDDDDPKKAIDATATAIADASVSAVGTRVAQVATVAAQEIARINGLTPSEVAALRTRMQYRLYQRNHRAKIQQRLDALTDEVSRLQPSLQELEQQVRQRWTQLAMTSLSAFTRWLQQPAIQGEDHEIAMLVTDDVCGVHGSGRTYLVNQRRWIRQHFRRWTLSVSDVVEYVDRHHDSDSGRVVCRVQASLTLRVQLADVASLFPRLCMEADEQTRSRLAAETFVIVGSGSFHVNADGRIDRWLWEMDVLSALHRVARSLVDVSRWSRGTRWCFSTAMQAPTETTETARHSRAAPCDRRLRLDYLLDRHMALGD